MEISKRKNLQAILRSHSQNKRPVLCGFKIEKGIWLIVNKKIRVEEHKSKLAKLSSLSAEHDNISDILDSHNNNRHSSLELNILNAIDDHPRTSLEPIFTPSETQSQRPSSTCTMGMCLCVTIWFCVIEYHANEKKNRPFCVRCAMCVCMVVFRKYESELKLKFQDVE